MVTPLLSPVANKDTAPDTRMIILTKTMTRLVEVEVEAVAAAADTAVTQEDPAEIDEEDAFDMHTITIQKMYA